MSLSVSDLPAAQVSLTLHIVCGGSWQPQQAGSGLRATLCPITCGTALEVTAWEPWLSSKVQTVSPVQDSPEDKYAELKAEEAAAEVPTHDADGKQLTKKQQGQERKRAEKERAEAKKHAAAKMHPQVGPGWVLQRVWTLQVGPVDMQLARR